MTDAALAGRTVVVTRAGRRAEELRGRLRRAGAEVLEVPLTAQVDAADGGAALRGAVAALGSFAWVVVTSVNAVERLVAATGRRRLPGALRVAAVGPATAAALRAAGVEVDLVPAVHNAAGLVESFPVAGPGPGAPTAVLFPAADRAPATIEEGLRSKGWDVRRVEAYRTVDVTAPDEALLARVSTADAIVFTAASAVRAFGALRTPDGRTLDPPGLVVCIGPSTAGAARAAGWRVVHEAPRTSSEGIVAALGEHLGPSPAAGS